MTEKSTIILVHGAWSNACTWDDVVPLLQAAGHEVSAIDLPSHGKHTAMPHDVGLADYARRVSAELEQVGPAVLVGHSMGGMAISAGAELVPDLVQHLVFIAAFLPQSGQSLVDLVKQQDVPGIHGAIQVHDPRGSTILDPDIAGDILFQDATPDQRGKALTALDTQPNRAQTDKADLTQDRFGRIPRSYVICEQDRTVTPDLQRKMIASSPYTQAYSLDCGHVPQLTQPRELADILTTI